MSHHVLLASSQKYIYIPNQLRIDGRGAREWAQCVHESLIRPEAVDDFYFTILQDSPGFDLEVKTRRSNLDPKKIYKDKLAFKRCYDALLETNRQVLREGTQEHKDMMRIESGARGLSILAERGVILG
jgi:hypothetical protein